MIGRSEFISASACALSIGLTPEFRPGFVVYGTEIFGILLQAPFTLVHVLEAVTWLLLQALDTFVDVVREESFGQFTQVGVLVEVVLEPVVFEQADVVFEIIGIGIQRREFEAFRKQAPPLVAVPEIDGAVHRLHPFLGEPFFGCVEHQVGYLLVVDRFEETAATRRLSICSGSQFRVIERRDASDGAALRVEGEPADRLSVPQQFVVFGVEAAFDVLVQRTDPIRFVAVKPFGEVEEFAGIVPGGYFFEAVFLHLLSVG